MKLIALLLATLLAATACSSSGQPYEVKRSYRLPTVLLTPDRPTATISFAIDIEPAESLQVVLPLGSWHTVVDVSLHRDRVEMPLDENRIYRCSGRECLGDYRVEASWSGGEAGEIHFGSSVTMELDTRWPESPRLALGEPRVEIGSVVLAQGTADWSTREWIAIRAYEGLQDPSRFSVMTTTHTDNARVSANEVVYEVPFEERERSIAMPSSCLESACGSTVYVEWAPADGSLDRGSFDWRLVDNNPTDRTVDVVSETEALPQISGEGRFRFEDVSYPSSDFRVFRVIVPPSLVAGVEPDRPIEVRIWLEAMADDDTVVAPTIRLDRADWPTRVSFDHITVLDPQPCAGPTSCEIEVRMQSYDQTATGEASDATVVVSATASLPHLATPPANMTLEIEEAVD